MCFRAQAAKRYRANPEPARERSRKWLRENKERHAEYMLLAFQDGRCAICGSDPTPGISLHVDHDHESGERRGLLCFKCNNALGDFGDDTGQLSRAVAYLESHDPDVQFLAQRTRQRLAALVN